MPCPIRIDLNSAYLRRDSSNDLSRYSWQIVPRPSQDGFIGAIDAISRIIEKVFFNERQSVQSHLREGRSRPVAKVECASSIFAIRRILICASFWHNSPYGALSCCGQESYTLRVCAQLYPKSRPWSIVAVPTRCTSQKDCDLETRSDLTNIDQGAQKWQWALLSLLWSPRRRAR